MNKKKKVVIISSNKKIRKKNIGASERQQKCSQAGSFFRTSKIIPFIKGGSHEWRALKLKSNIKASIVSHDLDFQKKKWKYKKQHTTLQRRAELCVRSAATVELL